MSFFKDIGKLTKDFEGLASGLTGDKKKKDGQCKLLFRLPASRLDFFFSSASYRDHDSRTQLDSGN